MEALGALVSPRLKGYASVIPCMGDQGAFKQGKAQGPIAHVRQDAKFSVFPRPAPHMPKEEQELSIEPSGISLSFYATGPEETLQAP